MVCIFLNLAEQVGSHETQQLIEVVIAVSCMGSNKIIIMMIITSYKHSGITSDY